MKEKAKIKRQAILESALQVFVEHGYEKTKISDVAKLAGIGKGTVYEYFDSKEELFHCLLVEYCQLYQGNVKKILLELEGKTCREKLLAIMHSERELKDQVHLRSLNPMQLLIEFTNFPGLKQAIQEMLRFKFEMTASILAEGVSKGQFRPMNVSLATAALMGAGSAIDSLYGCALKNDVGEEGAEPLVAAETMDGFDCENILDLLICGLHS